MKFVIPKPDAGDPGKIPGTAIATFDTTVEGFALETFKDTSQVNLNDGTHNPAPTLMWDGTQGSPSTPPGSLVVTAPYSGASQYVDVQKILPSAQDWSGMRTLFVRVKVTTGTFTGGVQLYTKTGMAYVFGGTFTNVVTGSDWQTFSMNIDKPVTVIAGYDPKQVVSVGLQINTGMAGSAATPVTFNIDSVSVDPPPASAAADASSN